MMLCSFSEEVVWPAGSVQEPGAWIWAQTAALACGVRLGKLSHPFALVSNL